MKTKNKKPFMLRIETELLDQLNEICNKNSLYYKSGLINQAIKEFLENNKEELK
jgi:metal-responsive CopG/Arc/MetJ family transcriptional regulator